MRLRLGVMLGSIALLMATACGDSSSSAPPVGPAGPNAAASQTREQIQIDTSHPAQAALWPAARLRLAACEPLTVDILYAFGIARLESAPGADGCRLQISTRGELGETDDWQHRYTCGAPVLELDWLPAQAGDAATDRPPDDALAGRAECQEL